MCQVFCLFFTGFASADLFTSDEFFTEVLHFYPTVGLEPYNDNFDELGFGTKSMVYNLGDISIIQLYIPLLALLLILKKCGCCKCF
jgi:hypothetical protein